MICILLICFLLLSSTATHAEEIVPCNNKEIIELIKGLGISDNIKDDISIFRQLERLPQQAAACLIRELHVVPEKEIKPAEVEDHQEAMHIVWYIRALRYITGGMDFTGKTKYEPEDSERTYRWQFLTAKHKTEVPFFSVWMSRDIIYFAPEDAQAEIIRKWSDWYSTQGKTFDYKPSESINDWYF